MSVDVRTKKETGDARGHTLGFRRRLVSFSRIGFGNGLTPFLQRGFGALAKYAKLVSSASLGAITD